MRLLLLTLPALLLGLLLALPAQAAPELLSETVDGVPVKVLSLTPAEFHATFHFPGNGGGTTTASAALEANPEAFAAFNGGYFLPGGKPLGLLVQEGKALNPLRKADWGVFYLEAKGNPRILHRKDYAALAPTPAPVFAIECGPRLVVAGKALTFKPSRDRRTALAITAEGRILVVVFPRPVELGTVSDYLLRRWAVTDALNLDGGSSTQLATRLGSQSVTAQAHGIPVPYVVLLRSPRP
jgi:uncharacterized protein YigE (DUF2233 family)